ncbi:hypothetical protein ABT095_11365 [Kitasatospora sp. NPDC002227]|uniref:hypothetical protein n=1 Tax=Kitasatospora sp. NPDC002227 TaxID=3154773 RepID=UPI0033330FEA
MLTLHRAGLLLADPSGEPVADGAVLVEGDRVVALGPYAPVAGARERVWGGLLTPGLCNPYGQWLLETAYHPDPREELGEEPLLLDGELDETRRGGSARRGLQRMLGYGTTAVAGPFTSAAVRTAVARSGLVSFGGAGERGGLDPLAGAGLAAAVHRPLTVGGRADFAVFAVGSVAELGEAGAGSCLATVLGGRILYRRR